MAGGRARRSIDASRMSALVSRPGIDPRVWLTLATVDQLGFDAQEGIFADVTFVPTGERETAFVGAPYAGNQFGLWAPPDVGDLVLVAVPGGDNGEGPVVVARMWRAADRPPTDFQKTGTQDEPTEDVVLRVREGKKLKVKLSGDAGEVDIQVEGNTHVKIRAGAQVQMQDASQAYMRTDDYNNQLNSFLTALDTFLTGLITAVPAPPNGALTVAVVAPLATALRAATSAFNGARSQWLSTKIKGQ